MARQQQGVSRQELNRRQRVRGFIGRTRELSAFRDNLARDPQDEGFQYLFHVRGNAGVGKTSLVRQWEEAARARDAATAYVDDSVHSVIEAMEAIGRQLEQQGLEFKNFQKLLADYWERRHEAETAPMVSAADADPSASSTVLATAGLATLGMVPGLGAVAGAMDPQQVAQLADRMRALGTRFRSHEDVQLLVDPVRSLTPVFLADLQRAAARRPLVVLFFDVLEETGRQLNEWLRDVLAGDKYEPLPVNIVAVLSGQGRLDSRYWAEYLRFVHQVQLEAFTEEEARDLLAAHGITSEPVIEVILRLTGRLPVLVDMLAQTHPENPDDIGDPSGDAVDRFLKWINAPERRTAALTCALPLQLDADVYRAAVPDAAADQYPWLRALPFVVGQGGRCRYHDAIRGPMLRLQRTESAARWRAEHTRLAETFQQWREDREAALAPDTYADDPDWREHRLSETYHRLCADPVRALPDALLEVVHACDDGTTAVRRWTQTLTQAGRDTDNARLTAWGQRLQDAAADEATATTDTLTSLLAAPELTTAARAWAHTIRGLDHRLAERYDQAHADYTAALALAPDLARAHYGRGETHRLNHVYDQALTSFDRAIALDPTDTEVIASRALTYQLTERYEDALTDYNRAIELNPAYTWAITSRALTYRLMERYEDALTDYNRAIALDPDQDWAIAGRGQTYQLMARYEDAVTDFDRAIALDPTFTWAITGRGETHRLMQRYEDALTDFGRAVELDPAYAWAIASRGQTYRQAGRYEDAVTDLDRAIALNPNENWYHCEIALSLHLLGRPEEMDHWRTAIALFAAEAASDGPAGTEALGHLIATNCAISQWDEAAQELERFLSRGPSRQLIQDALDDLTELETVTALDPARLLPLRQRLEGA